LTYNGSGTITIGNATDTTIVEGGLVRVPGNFQLGDSNGDYQYMRIGGGNSAGFIYGSYAGLSDGIHIGYNAYYDKDGVCQIPVSIGRTSRLTLRYGNIQGYYGSTGAAPETLAFQVGDWGTILGDTSVGLTLRGSSGAFRRDYSGVTQFMIGNDSIGSTYAAGAELYIGDPVALYSNALRLGHSGNGSNHHSYIIAGASSNGGLDISTVNGDITLTPDGVIEMDGTTISATQWGYLGALNQALTTTSAVTFGGVTTTSIIPSSDVSVNCGSSAYSWANVFTRYVAHEDGRDMAGYASGTGLITIGNSTDKLAFQSSAAITTTASLHPSSDYGCDLGSSSVHWNIVYSSKVLGTSCGQFGGSSLKSGSVGNLVSYCYFDASAASDRRNGPVWHYTSSFDVSYTSLALTNCHASSSISVVGPSTNSSGTYLWWGSTTDISGTYAWYRLARGGTTSATFSHNFPPTASSGLIQSSGLAEYVGKLVECTGDLRTNDGEYTINDVKPYVALTTTAQSKKVIGFISSHEGDLTSEDIYDWSDHSSLKREGLVRVNAVGEGLAWVCNENGTIEAGDLLCSSNQEGAAMKQSDDVVHAYTAAKAVETTAFDDESTTTEDGVKFRLIGVIYMAG
jgi:hypothetical protein